ncbi:hypothetical protein [Rhodoplanes roseus]|nr:hypothetical protein [Rhodoplanes roseus]
MSCAVSQLAQSTAAIAGALLLGVVIGGVVVGLARAASIYGSDTADREE